MALELLALEEEAARVRELVAAQKKASTALKPKQEAGPRWRSAGEDEDEPAFPTLEQLPPRPARPDAVAERLAPEPLRRGGSDTSGTPRAAAPPPPPKKAPARRPGEWHGVSAFLESIGLAGNGYDTVLLENGLDSADALATLDDARLRRLGIPPRHAVKLKVGIAELRAFAASAPAQPAAGREAGGARAAGGHVPRAPSPAHRDAAAFAREVRPGRPPAARVSASARASSERRDAYPAVERAAESHPLAQQARPRQPRAASVPRAVSIGLAPVAGRGIAVQVPRPPSAGRRRPTSADRARQPGMGNAAGPPESGRAVASAAAVARRGRGPASASPDERPLLAAHGDRPRLERRPRGAR